MEERSDNPAKRRCVVAKPRIITIAHRLYAGVISKPFVCAI